MPKGFDEVYETAVNEVMEEIRINQLRFADSARDDEEFDVIAQLAAQKARLKEQQKAKRREEQRIKRKAKKKLLRVQSETRVETTSGTETGEPWRCVSSAHLTWNGVLEETTEDNDEQNDTETQTKETSKDIIALNQPLAQQNDTDGHRRSQMN